MFNKTLVLPSRQTEYITRDVVKTVNINKPSTAEDLAFLQDMRETVQNEFIGKVDIESSCFKGEVYAMNNPMMQRIDVILRTTINGENIDERGEIDPGFESYEDTMRLFRGEVERLCEKVIKEQVFKKIKLNGMEIFKPFNYL